MNGYADAPGDVHRMSMEDADILSSAEDTGREKESILARRRNSVEPRAFAVKLGGNSEGYEAAVLFRPCKRQPKRNLGAPPGPYRAASLAVLVTRNGVELSHYDFDASKADVFLASGEPTAPGACESGSAGSH